MKKSKLLAPLFGLATVATVAIPMVACQKPQDNSINMKWVDSIFVNGDNAIAFKKSTNYVFKFTPTDNDQLAVKTFQFEDESGSKLNPGVNTIKVTIQNKTEAEIPVTAGDVTFDLDQAGERSINKTVTIAFTTDNNFNEGNYFVKVVG